MNGAINILLWATYLILLYFSVFWLIVFLENPNLKHKRTKKKLSSFPFVTIAVPAYNEENTIVQTLNSLIALDYPKDKLEILIVNDASKDNTKKLAEKIIKKNPAHNIQLINREVGGQGKAAVVNLALAQAKGEYFVCFDADSIISPNALNKLLPLFTSKDIACVLPMMKVYKPKTLLEKIQWYEYILNMYYKRLMSYLNCVHVAPGPFSVYKTEILKKVGKFSTESITEDMEICMRLQKEGYRILQSFDTEVWTVTPTTMKGIYNQRNRWYKGAILTTLQYKSMMFNKKYGDFGMIQLPFIIVPAVAAIFLLLTHTIYAFRDGFDLIFNFSSIGFDFMTLFNDITLNFNLLDINMLNSYMAVFMVVLMAIIFVSSHKHTNEKVLKHGFFPLALYIGIFPLALSIMWLAIFFDVMVGKVQKW